jgi:hypothetical protein
MEGYGTTKGEMVIPVVTIERFKNDFQGFIIGKWAHRTVE